jgi:hypothetical protein
MRIDINTQLLETAAKSAWKDTSQIMGIEFTKAISDPIYNWPRGESPRDIVDKGGLRQSQRMDYSGDFVTNYRWPLEYALPVHNGAVLRNGTILNARPWTKIAIQRRNPAEVFSRLMEAQL